MPLTPRKPTIPERVELAAHALDAITRAKKRGIRGEPYDIAFKELGSVHWLHRQSRDGIAAYAATCWIKGAKPYEGVNILAAENERRNEVHKAKQFHQHRLEEVAGLMNAGHTLEEIAQLLTNGPYSLVYVKRFMDSASDKGIS